MSSIITAVFKATIGLLVNKGRSAVAEKLKEGDVTDQKIRGLIVREIQDIKSKLDGLARKDLLAAIDVFEVGLGYLYQAVDAKRNSATTPERKGRVKEENCDESIPPSPAAAVNTVSLASGMRNLELTELDETIKSALSYAAKRFEMAREKATEASNNEALSTLDRVTAIRYRVMATMLESAIETVGSAGDLSSLAVKKALKRALPESEQCLEKLHSLPAVQNSFKVELEKGFRGLFGKDERREIISTVCKINRVIYDAKQTVGENVQVWVWPSIDTGEDKVDPLRDARVAKALRKVGVEHCCFTSWSFGQKGEEEFKLKWPRGIATNAEGQFLIPEEFEVKIFNSNGDFLRKFKLQNDDAFAEFRITDVATDTDSNTYVLVYVKTIDAEEVEEVQVFTNTAVLHHKFPVKGGHRLAVSHNKVLVLRNDDAVDVYEHDGEFVRSFGEGTLKYVRDIAAAKDGRVLILNSRPGDLDNRTQGYSCVRLFTVEGEEQSKFNIKTNKYIYHDRIACHPTGEYVVVTAVEEFPVMPCRPTVAIYTQDGEFVRSIQLDEGKNNIRGGITVTMDGRIALAVGGEMTSCERKVIVLSN